VCVLLLGLCARGSTSGVWMPECMKTCTLDPMPIPFTVQNRALRTLKVKQLHISSLRINSISKKRVWQWETQYLQLSVIYLWNTMRKQHWKEQTINTLNGSDMSTILSWFGHMNQQHHRNFITTSTALVRPMIKFTIEVALSCSWISWSWWGVLNWTWKSTRNLHSTSALQVQSPTSGEKRRYS
jgi:hypothetical protein